MIKAVIFDFDDTIINNSSLDYEGFIRPCKELGIPTPDFKRIMYFRKKRLLARGIALKIQEHTKKKFSISKFISLRNEFLQSKESTPFLNLNTGTRNLLSFLKSKKIRCFLCSIRKNKKIIIDFLVKNDIRDYFSGIYLMNDIGPDLDNSYPSNRVLIKNSLIHKIIKDQLISNSNVVFIGNSEDDYNSALNMHVKFIYYENLYIGNTVKGAVKVQNMKSLKRKLFFMLRNL